MRYSIVVSFALSILGAQARRSWRLERAERHVVTYVDCLHEAGPGVGG